jgi:hypothetical protein
MTSSLIQNQYIQYKFNNYHLEPVEIPFGESGVISSHKINTINQSNYNEVVIELEPTIQYLNSIKLNECGMGELALNLTNKYGFLYFKDHVIRAKTNWDFFELHDKLTGSKTPRIIEEKPFYDGEDISRWWFLVETVQFISKSISDSKYLESVDGKKKFFHYESINNIIKSIYLQYDMEKHSVSLHANSLASAIVMHVVSQANHLKKCEECSALFFAKRSNAQFCNNNCAKKNQRNRNK